MLGRLHIALNTRDRIEARSSLAGRPASLRGACTRFFVKNPAFGIGVGCKLADDKADSGRVVVRAQVLLHCLDNSIIFGKRADVVCSFIGHTCLYALNL
jgi:hypothetical protein